MFRRHGLRLLHRTCHSTVLQKNKTTNATIESSKPIKHKMDTRQKSTKTIVTSTQLAKPIGPYSQAIVADNSLYISGMLGMGLDSKLEQGAEKQAQKALENLESVLAAGGSSLEGVVKCTVLLKNMECFQAVNQVYSKFFPKNAPARVCYQVAKLPLDAEVEIDAIALRGTVEVIDCKL